MAENRQVKYKGKIASSEFAQTLTHRVDAYFRDRDLSKHANAHMVAKTILGFALWISSYLVLMSDRFSAAGVVAMFVVHGFAQLFVAYNISHDANHGAYSSSPRVNKALSWTFDLVGVSSYVWRLLHNASHHSFVNVEGKDTSITSGNLLRFSPGEKWVPLHRYQHLYAPILYSLATLHWVVTKDFRWFFFSRDFGNRRITKHPRKELVFLLATKAFYYTYMLVLPIMFLSVPWYYVVVGFLVMHAFIGFHISLIFQPTHITEETEYPHPDDDGYLTNNFLMHVLSTTADYSRGRPLTTWALGCLNLHVTHHMYSAICHVHYPALTEIIKETIEEFGYRYRENETVVVAFRAHLRMLKALGRPDPTWDRARDHDGTVQHL